VEALGFDIKKMVQILTLNQVMKNIKNFKRARFEFLKSHLWSAADVLRGSLDPIDYHQSIAHISS
jgi:hypothetical protein